MLPERLTVIANDHEDRVIQPAGLGEPIHEPAQRLIGAHESAVIVSAREPARRIAVSCVRRMGVVGPHSQKKRPSGLYRPVGCRGKNAEFGTEKDG